MHIQNAMVCPSSVASEGPGITGAKDGPLKFPIIQSLLRDQRGAVMTEYVVVTGFIGLASISALLFCGYMLAGSFSFVRNYTLYPFP